MDVRSQRDAASSSMVASVVARARFHAQPDDSPQFRAVQAASLRLLNAFVHPNQAIFNLHSSVVGQGQGERAPGARSSGLTIAEAG